MKKFTLFTSMTGIVLIAYATSLYYTSLSTIVINSDKKEMKFSYKLAGKGINLWEQSDSYPLVIVLPGKSHSASEFYEKLFKSQAVPYRFILLDCPYVVKGLYGWWTERDEIMTNGNNLQLVIEQLRIKFQSKNKPILLGYEDGADMVYYLATNFGTDYSLAFPIGGDLDLDFMTKNRNRLDNQKYVLIYSFQSQENSNLALKIAEQTVINIRRKNFDIDLIDYPDALDSIFSSNKSDFLSEFNLRIEDVFEL
jgi:hypothetical protein